MCGCNDLICAGHCPCGCTHSVKSHDKALREQIARELENEITQHKCNHTYCINRIADEVLTLAVSIARGKE